MGVGPGRAWMLAVGRGVEACCRRLGAMSAGGAQAVQHARAEALPFERARTMLLLGQLQRRQRRKETSARTIRAAWPCSRTGHSTVGRSGPRRVGQIQCGPATGRGPYAPKRVAELAASGMTNRDVAATLFISPKTVETNLAHIYRKLGIRSRVELASSIFGRSADKGIVARVDWIQGFITDWIQGFMGCECAPLRSE